MKPDPDVRLDVGEGVATVTLNRPDDANSINLPMAIHLLEVFEEIAADASSHVVLLRGNGRFFCTGGDLREMDAAPDRGQYLAELAHTMHEAIKLLAGFEKVVVAEVQGSAAGAGLSLVLASDIVYAAESAKFLTAYATVGLTPDCGQSWLLPRVVGLGRAPDLTLEPRHLVASDALDWGIVSRVVSDDVLSHEAALLAQRIATGPAEALGRSRLLLRRGLTSSLEDHLDQEDASISYMASTADTGRRIDAFLG